MDLAQPSDANPDRRHCQTVSLKERTGFVGLSFDGATDSTDASGRSVSSPARNRPAAADNYLAPTSSVTAITTSGTITASLKLR